MIRCRHLCHALIEFPPAVACLVNKYGNTMAVRLSGHKVLWRDIVRKHLHGSPLVPGTPPTVYTGSENGQFFALHARTGRKLWSHDVGGPIPGTATVIGDHVFTSSFKTKRAIGIDVRTRKEDFVSNGRHLFVVGYCKLVGLEPAHPSNRRPTGGPA